MLLLLLLLLDAGAGAGAGGGGGGGGGCAGWPRIVDRRLLLRRVLFAWVVVCAEFAAAAAYGLVDCFFVCRLVGDARLAAGVRRARAQQSGACGGSGPSS